jgi:ribosomal protein S18 acetylase RimI-like enzyme
MIIKHTNITDNEIFQIASLHRNNIGQGFLSTLGGQFLSYLYKAVRGCQSGILIIAIDNNSVIGFVAGTTDLKSIYKLLIKKYKFQVLIKIIPHILSIENIKKLSDTILYSNQSDTKSNLPKSELLSIAIDQNFRGKTAASLLFSQLNDEFKKRQVKQFKIVVGSDLKRARSFYKKMGAVELSQIEIHSGSQSSVYIMDIQ